MRDPYTIMARAIAKFLESQGWRVVLVSGGRVTQPIAYPKQKFQFEVDFLGAKPSTLGRARKAGRA